nr:NADH dehydrogenase subunit 6 [Laomedia astacina]
MLFFTLPVIMSLSFMFMRLLHPLSMGLTLLFQTCLICVSSGLFNQSFWFSYILFLIFLGGMLVLFIYVASLASNEPFKFSMFFTLVSFFMLFYALLFFFIDPMSLTSKINLLSSGIVNSYGCLDIISMIYNVPAMSFTLYMVMYLLLTLFVVVHITGNYFGPLRLSTYDNTNT